MFLSQILLICLTVLLLARYLWCRRKFYVLSWKMNSLLGLPFLGNLRFPYPQHVINFCREMRKEWKEKYGILWVGTAPMLYVSEPEIAKKILMSTSFYNKMDFYDIAAKHIGRGLVTLRTPTWNQHRKLIEPVFNTTILKNHIPVYNKSANYLLQKLENNIKNVNGTWLLPYFQMCTLDIACETTMGKFMNFQDNEDSEIVEAYRVVVNTMANRSPNPLYQLDFIFNYTEWAQKSRDAEQVLKNFVGDLLKIKIKKKNSKATLKNDSNQDFEVVRNHNIFIDNAVKFLEEQKFSWNDAIDESNIMVLAAVDATANAMCNTLMCLAMFPEYQDKVFEEISAVFPDRDGFEVTMDDLLKLNYLEMVFNESMRILAPIPFFGRGSTEDFKLSNDITLPKGTQVIFDVFHLHRDESNWGPRAKTFYPDHFLIDNFKQIHPFAYMPFAKGARNCIGWKYGMNAAKTILAKIIRKFKFSTDMKFEELQYYFDITLKFQTIPMIKISERER